MSREKENYKYYAHLPKSSGVYQIVNVVTGDSYIGSSKDIRSRVGTHFGREYSSGKKYPLYEAMREYGKDKFECNVLMVCDNLQEFENAFIQKFNPTYNQILPLNHQPLNGYNPNTQSRQLANVKRKELYNTSEYKLKFREQSKWKFKAVRMYNDSGVNISFESIQDCAKWITHNTSFKGKNKASKIVEVCKGKRLRAYGFKFEYLL